MNTKDLTLTETLVLTDILEAINECIFVDRDSELYYVKPQKYLTCFTKKELFAYKSLLKKL